MFLINVIFLLSGSIYYILALLLLIDFVRTKFTNDLFLVLYFIFSASTLPVLGLIPITADYEKLLYWTLFISTLCVPMTSLCLNLYLDYSILEKVSFFTIIISIFTGCLLGFLLFNDSLKLIFKPSLFGLYPGFEYSTTNGIIAFAINILIILISQSRFLIQGIQKIRHMKLLENFPLMKLFFLCMFLGPILWLTFNILKRFFPMFFGFDILFLTIFYSILIGLYRKKRELFYFLPSALDRIILIYRNGTPMFDFNFKAARIEEENESADYREFNFLRNVFYATTLILHETYEKQMHNKELLQHIVFERSQIIYHASDHICWLLITQSNHSIFFRLLERISNRIETAFREELMNMALGVSSSPELKNALSSECLKYTV